MGLKQKRNSNGLNIVSTALAARLHTYGKQVEQNAKRSMRDGGDPHVPSLSGEPPRIDTKTLHESITTETERDQRTGETETRVGTNVDYGLHLELGTSKMKPRPWLRPALQGIRKK